MNNDYRFKLGSLLFSTGLIVYVLCAIFCLLDSDSAISTMWMTGLPCAFIMDFMPFFAIAMIIIGIFMIVKATCFNKTSNE